MMRFLLLLFVPLLLANSSFAQDRKISGSVKADDGSPIIGAVVTAKDQNAATQTDADGLFSLDLPEEAKTLILSYIGYENLEVAITQATSYDVVMKTGNSGLEEVVVVGYGTQRQKDLTGSVSSVTSERFNQGVVLSPQQSIQGKMAGVNISQNSGKPGGSNTIRIRGGTSLTGSNDPLYVIDGVPISTSAGVAQANIRGNGTDIFDQEPTNPLMTLNPDDIESVTALKDASASAIYGSRAANGVIVITTKKGVAGAPKVSVSATGGISNVAKKMNVLSADQYRAEATKLGLTIDDKGANTDWQDEIFRTAFLQDYGLSLSGGAEKTTYRATLGYGSQEGVMIGSKMDRANARLNINHSALNDKLTFDLRTTYGRTFSRSAPVSNTVGSEAGTSMNYEAYVFNPTYPVYDSNGDFYDVPPYRVNPVSFATEVTDETTNTRFLGNLSTTYKFIKQLSLNVNLGYTNQGIDRNSYIAKSNLLGQGLGGYASVQKLMDYSKLLESVLRYNDHFGKHSVDAILGYSWQYFQNQGDRTTANGFLSDEFKWYSLQAAQTISSATTFQSSNKLISFYGRVNYNFDDRFLVTGTVRRDGSSRFGPENKWGYFPSGSVAWRLSQEKFFKIKPISDLKVRVSYGVTGNQEIGNLNSVTTLGASSTGYIVGGNRVTIVLPQQYANPDIKWEQTAQFDAGLDFGLFGGRLRGTIDFYNKKTSDLLLAVRVPSPTVVNTQIVNVGSVQNRGIELELNADVIQSGKFYWQSSLNVSRNVNKVLSLSNDKYKGDNINAAPIQGAGLQGGYAQIIKPGYSLGTFYGKELYGIKDGKEILSTYDTILGSAQPKFSFGFSNYMSYGKFSLSFMFRGVVGNKIYNLTANNLGYLNNLPGRNVLESATTAGVDRDQPKVYSSRWIENGSYIRLDNLTLSYSLHLKTDFFKNARVFVTGQNLLVITGYSGLDPEVNSEISATGIAPLGVDYLSYPRARSFSIGFNTNF
jgi:TonB-linked SusC/RagA family outer membrane protein